MATIKPIEGRTVHQIQSGQVIVDLCSVVKELVENSLDAGATSVEVRFKDQGLEAIEVQDNGDGISPHNYETLALKHHTSKLSTYSDLTTLQTFGFRGEALSSLCALSRFSVITCMAQDAPKGTRLEFEVSGALKGTSIVAAQKGTTVSVESLFNNLPVRRRELERNIKREWGRVVAVLGQYACIQTGIKFSVTQQAGKGKKTTLFSTKGNQTTRENIINVFGAKTLTALVPMDLKLELEPTSDPSQRCSTKGDAGKKDIRILGHISRPAFGEGRHTPDRQMFFVNARPCGLPQVAKAFNEVYKGYNTSQSPFIFANIELDTHMYDVNVSPDKRTILLHDQTRMLENLKVALTELFESQDYTVPISQLPAQRQPSYKQLTISRENTASVKASSTMTESTEGEESDDGSGSSTRAQSFDDHDQEEPYNPKPGRGAVSRESMNRDGGAVSLISNWLGRKTEDRTDQPARKPQPLKAANEGHASLSKDKRRLTEKLGQESEQSGAPNNGEPEPDISVASSVASTQSSRAPHSQEALDQNFSQVVSESHQPEVDDDQGDQPHEQPVPAIPSPSKLSSTISNVFSKTPGPRRTLGETATITIGDHTVTSSIGTPCPSNLRLDAAASHGASRLKSSTISLPSFGSSLTERFAAPGTMQQPSASEDSDEDGAPALPSSLLLESPSPTQESVEAPAAVVSPSSSIVVKAEEVDSSILNFQDDEYEEDVNEEEKKAREEAKIQEMLQVAEDNAVQASQDQILRTKGLLKGAKKRKDTTINLVQYLNTDTSRISEQIQRLDKGLNSFHESTAVKANDEALDSDRAEEKLSLTISKSDFSKMKIVGQFNLGFILASRSSATQSDDGPRRADDLFIIDQHASDEKYNFERLQSTTIVQSQRLVYPKKLDLTAMEEEIVIENLSALETSGFVVTVDQSGDSPIGQRCKLVSLPLSRETAFSLTDLEELIVLLSEAPQGTVPRPSKVRKIWRKLSAI
ncbi:pms1 [Hyphodiscus hymeniophilus]|uniref:DNA mismatch repair protein PMS1 n=1 Tax=Hyphodiscus hymeniophilus TaxID=353542 RepID=A0A9P6VKF0_9HELO|nr:pms1 [Hyphodiscus hymeniophilus]